jgi:hypothetical protein
VSSDTRAYVDISMTTPDARARRVTEVRATDAFVTSISRFGDRTSISRFDESGKRTLIDV